MKRAINQLARENCTESRLAISSPSVSRLAVRLSWEAPVLRLLVLWFAVLAGILITEGFCADAEQKLDFNVIQGTLNGRVIFEYTLDEITDLLGPPSAIEKPNEHRGLTICYHNQGVQFYFGRPKSNPKQNCLSVEVFLTRYSGKHYIGTFQAFSGKVNEGMDRNSKRTRILEAFKQYNPKDQFDPTEYARLKKLMEQSQAVGLPNNGLDFLVETLHEIHIVRDTHLLSIKYAEVTGFVERLEISSK